MVKMVELVVVYIDTVLFPFYFKLATDVHSPHFFRFFSLCLDFVKSIKF